MVDCWRIAICLATVSTVTGALAYDHALPPPMGVEARYLNGGRDRATSLQETLKAREQSIASMKQKLDMLDDAAEVAEAQRLGIVALLKTTSLNERQQRRIAAAIVRESRRNNLDPLLVAALIRTESQFNNYAVSSAGAIGLMQVMPDTAKFWATQQGTPFTARAALYDAEINIELGTSYLAALIEKFGDLKHALVAYNAGPTAAKKLLSQPATRRKVLVGYPTKVVAEHKRLKARMRAVAQGELRLAAAEG